MESPKFHSDGFGCLECHDHGWILADDLALTRCDTCNRYRSDLEAAQGFFESPESVAFHLKRIVVSPVL